MPVKNAAQYIAECLNSIVHQSFSNWELIAVNDHSIDHTFKILKEFEANEARIKIFNNEGNGIIEALRLAYKNSKGNYITRMDADDIMLPNKIETLYQNLKKYGLQHIAIGQVSYFSANKLGQGYLNYANWLNRLTENGNNYNELYKECVIPSPSWMLHKSDFDKCGAFNENTYPEDYDLCFRFYQSGLKCIPCNQVIHKWRDYPERTSRNDEHYADNKFIALKCSYFLKLNWNKERPLIIWGAGKKGKAIAKYFADKNIKFMWLCNNENKIGHIIFNVKLQSIETLSNFVNPQIIIAIANPMEQKHIKKTLLNKKLRSMNDYFFFC